MVREIMKFEEPVLYKKCHAVTKFDAKLGKLLDDMTDTMMQANGVGLAAPQVGILRRICVVLDTMDNDKVIEMVNPEIIELGGVQIGQEGCLSFPGEFGTVKRARTCTVRAQDRSGEWFEVKGEDLTARAFQHEIDHLDGKVFKMFATEMFTADDVEVEE